MSTSDKDRPSQPPGEQTLFDQNLSQSVEEEEESRWPSQERFPLNEGGREVGEAVAESYEASSSFSIVTAYTSLEHLLAFFSQHDLGGREVDIVLGSEPTVTEGDLYAGTRPIEKRARDYWLEKGVSVLTGGGAVRLIEAIEKGQVRFFAGENLHAKIYLGEESAIFGSSNFSRQGLRQQREANGRFERGADRYEELSEIVSQFKSESRECSAEIRELLEDLLQPVRWEEALARAAAEVLEGDWVKRYPDAFRLLQGESLWPHQEQAIAQGLWILDTRGSVLVADATGSGKTRIGTHLLYGLLNRLWAQGQVHRTDATVVCPPQVTGEWEKEIKRSEALEVSAISHGMLSQGANAKREREEVRQANVLFLDEAHNYLSRKSKRSRAIASSAADYSALLTATPINRGSGDLLRMIELLGLDNLSDPEFRVYKALRKKTNLTGEDEEKLRRIVRQCTIRRTKQDLNEVVSRRPDGYTDEEGTVHRFPEHVCRTYRTGETEEDRRLASEINELSEELKGLLWLREFKAAPWELGDREREKAFIDRRVKGADGLSTHFIQSALQSSKAALLEIIYGTEEAAGEVGLQSGLKTESGDYYSTVTELLSDPPFEDKNNNLKEARLPEWLGEDLEETVRREQDLLEKIGARARSLSEARTAARAEKIREISEEETVLLAFGAKPLTLHALRDHLQNGSTRNGTDPSGDGPLASRFNREVVVADGSLSAGKRKAVREKLGLGGGGQTTIGPEGEGQEGLVALCSDAMSEGLNLQRASSVVLLDTPSVIRIAEQRVGRIDRMDSPHDQIEVWWPEDSRPFQSARRDLLIERYNVNERLLGNNIDLPESIAGDEELFSEGAGRRAGAEVLIEKYQSHQAEGPGRRLDDAFRPARELVGLTSPGEQERRPLIEESLYEKIAGAEATVWSRITIMESSSRWGFFCMRGREGRAPRWILLEEGGPAEEPIDADIGEPTLTFEGGEWTDYTRLGPIARRLRSLIPEARSAVESSDPSLWSSIEEELGEMLGAIRENERDLLSNKAQHALGLLKTLADEYGSKARKGSDRQQICEFLSEVLSKESEPWADLHDLADRWLGLVQPRYVEWKRAQPHGRPVRIKDMTDPLIAEPIDTDALRRLAKKAERQEPVGRRLAAAIVAVPRDCSQ
jgi:superfamily II DNA or RNA helicase